MHTFVLVSVEISHFTSQMGHYHFSDLYPEEPHFVCIAYPCLSKVRQEHLVKGVLYAFGVVY